MDPLACVDVPALPLQLLRQRHPEWASRPVAVVDRDKPQGVILWADERARCCGVLPGMRYAAGLALTGDLCAGEVPAAEVQAGVTRLADILRRFTPDVEPNPDEPGVFWLGAAGLGRLYRSPAQWAGAVRSALRSLGLHSRIALGFRRFATYAAARAGLGHGLVLFQSPAEEDTACRKVPLRHLGLTPNLRDAVERLGIRTVGAFLDLPAAGLRERLGPEALRLHELAAGKAWAPLEPVPAAEPLLGTVDLDAPETDVYRLLFLAKSLLDSLLTRLAARREAVAELALHLRLDSPLGQEGAREERLRPAAPTLDSRQLLNLVHLRLEATALAGGVTRLELQVVAAPTTAEQLGLFAQTPRRDLAAADRALARLRAELGDAAVVRARLGEGHLPEAGFSWEPLERVLRPTHREVLVRPLVRRICARPLPLPPLARRDPDGWLLRGEECGPVDDRVGPYIVSGGWWRRPVHREYHFARTRNGEIFWIYYDRARRQWFLQGTVE